MISFVRRRLTKIDPAPMASIADPSSECDPGLLALLRSFHLDSCAVSLRCTQTTLLATNMQRVVVFTVPIVAAWLRLMRTFMPCLVHRQLGMVQLQDLRGLDLSDKHTLGILNLKKLELKRLTRLLNSRVFSEL